ncbi:methyltransferase CmcJ [Karstenula rhodostoma CBS 690.94]|uniref:Methyltransferase CmcJ n=1 Tax=Karstenula rhodostoma CBS 690.94 TaxID=1392251 RepID=A0A9P4U4I6_9PLEO|nr:methyltransferase CmcJ [Karstenula rhodostoma CBS 690.94]
MSTVAAMSRHEQAIFSYIQWKDIYKDEKPYEILADLPIEANGTAKTNITLEKGTADNVTDVRDREAEFSLDNNGFAFIKHKSDFTEFDKSKFVEDEFLPKVVEPFLKKHVEGADRIVFFDWHLRRNVREEAPEKIDINDGSHALLPVNYPHIDQSPASAILRVRQQFGEEADELLKGRVRIVNFWRPLWRPVVDAPLALCDGSTVTADDVILVDHVREFHVGETVYLRQKPTNKWYYLSHQQPDEVTLIKIFDSKQNCAAKWCPHASFNHADVGIGHSPRESIEVRALIFTKP